MPPAGRPWGRTWSAPNRSSWASDVTKTRSSVAGAQVERADHAVTVAEPDELEGVALRRVVGSDPLDDALLGAQRQPGRAGLERAQGERSLVRSELDELAHRRAPRQRRRAGGRREARQVEDREPDHAPGRRDHADRAARRGGHGGHDRVVRGPRPLGAELVRVGGAREEAGGGEQHVAGVVDDLQRGGRGTARAAQRTPAEPCVVVFRASWRPRPARRRPSCAEGLRRRAGP